ncbi:MAG TPA: hypothetical protein VGR35_07610 [Tepidisphaeraceae bacterium]|nr:hypothetical protein [Tepidisphaeraceae bacterium]
MSTGTRAAAGSAAEYGDALKGKISEKQKKAWATETPRDEATLRNRTVVCYEVAREFVYRGMPRHSRHHHAPAAELGGRSRAAVVGVPAPCTPSTRLVAGTRHPAGDPACPAQGVATRRAAIGR